MIIPLFSNLCLSLVTLLILLLELSHSPDFMSDPPFFPSLSFSPLQVLRVELAPVELDLGLLLEDFLDRWSKVQLLFIYGYLNVGDYVFQFMYFDLVKMDIMYLALVLMT